MILPVLNEASALPWVLSRMPVNYRPLVIDNGSTDGSATCAAELGARVVSEPIRGFGAACWTGLHASTADVVCFMDCDGSLDPQDLPVVTRPVVSGDADLVLGGRRAERGAWPLHARLANRVLAFEVRRRTGLALRDLGPMRAVKRDALLDLSLTDRRSGWPLEMVLLAHRAGLRITETSVPYRSTLVAPRSRGPSAAPSKRSAIWVHFSGEPPSGPGSGDRQVAGSRQGQDAAVPPTLGRERRRPRPRRAHGHDGRHLGCGPRPRGRSRSRGAGRWLRPGFDVLPQRSGPFADRLAGAIEDAYSALPLPVLLVGMDTPQLEPGQLNGAANTLMERGTDTVLGTAADGGFWIVGTRRPIAGMFDGVSMSTARTGAEQLARMSTLGLRCTAMGQLRDVDVLEDARAVARAAPRTRFAAVLPPACESSAPVAAREAVTDQKGPVGVE